MGKLEDQREKLPLPRLLRAPVREKRAVNGKKEAVNEKPVVNEKNIVNTEEEKGGKGRGRPKNPEAKRRDMAGYMRARRARLKKK